LAAREQPAAAVSTTVVRARVADQIIDTMRDRILTGVFPRGSKLPTEREFADEFGVSTPTIREAIRALTSLGLVEVRHGSGAYVRTNSDGLLRGPLGMLVQLESVGVEDLVGLIQVLDLYALDLAVKVADDEDIEIIRDAAERTAHCETLDDVQESVAAFLVAISAASHQPLLEALCGFLASMLVRLETSSYRRRGGTFWRNWAASTAPMRMAIVEALDDRDPERARAALTELHDHVVNRIRSVPALRDARLSDPRLGPFVREIVFGTRAG
jgi:GntR family transcriptional regulator, transcriptional repressor for pyruvate dehydrogenase complex